MSENFRGDFFDSHYFFYFHCVAPFHCNLEEETLREVAILNFVDRHLFRAKIRHILVGIDIHATIGASTFREIGSPSPPC